MTQTALYLCYQSVREPLTQTQVIAYLEGLTLAGYRLVLLTFEPRPFGDGEERDWQERLARKGIIWRWLRYHKAPTVPATAWDILCGVVVGWRLVQEYGVDLVHARSHVPGLMALCLKQLTGAKLVFDLRGLMAEEYVDAGVWPAEGRLFRATKRVERSLIQAADTIVVLTERAKELLQEWYPRAVRRCPVEVIPCCVDLRSAPVSASSIREPPGGDGPRVVYVGKLGGWYLTEAMVSFVATAREAIPTLRWDIWTQSDPAPLEPFLEVHGLKPHVRIGYVPPQDLPAALSKTSAALSFIKPCLSKLASSPTKVAEYLAAGLPVVSTAGIGDLDAILSGEEGRGPVGLLLRECTPDAFKAAMPRFQQLLADPETPARCRQVALAHFDLETVGWVRYRRVYDRLLANRG